MQISKTQLKKLIESSIKSILKENMTPEDQLNDIVGILELITEKVMSFPVDNPEAVQFLSQLTDVLEQIDGKLSKIVNLPN